MALRARDWRGAGPAPRPIAVAPTTPNRPVSGLAPPPPGLPGLKGGLAAPGLPATGAPLAEDLLLQGSGLFPSPVGPQLLAGEQPEPAFAGRMLEALEKYETMKRQGRP